MTLTTQTIKPIISSSDSTDFGSKTQVDVYDRYDMENADVSLRQMLSSNYGLEPHTNGALESNEDERKYRDSGLWYQSKGKHGEVEFDVTVGCSCEGDCCGHMCSLNITLQKTERHFTIISQMSYNY